MADRMDDEEFVDYAPETQDKVRANHDSATCSGGRDSMVVERKSDGSIAAYCFRCGAKGWKPSDTINPYKHRSAPDKTEVTLTLPNDLIPLGEEADEHWPVEAIMYLHEMGMYEDGTFIADANKNGWSIKYSKSANRIFFGKNSNTWLARSLDKKNPKKWIECMSDKYSDCLLDSADVVYKDGRSGPTTLVIVEDIVSALKIISSRNKVTVLVLFGSKFTSKHMALLTKRGWGNFKSAIVWMDNDTINVKMEQAHIKDSIESYSNVTTYIVKSDEDPKSYEYSKVADIITYPEKWR